jgi:hypothetical protein
MGILIYYDGSLGIITGCHGNITTLSSYLGPWQLLTDGMGILLYYRGSPEKLRQR